MLLLTLRGTPTMYYGDEIGMRDVPIPTREVQDPQGLNMPGKNLSRDPERTPMQWDGTPNSGFTNGQPWLRLDRSFHRRNVQTQRLDEHSSLCLYKKLISLRTRELSLQAGAYRPVYSDHQLIAYIRHAEGHPAFLVVLNLTHRPCYFTPENIRFTGVVVVDTVPQQEQVTVEDTIDLFGDEGMVIKLDAWEPTSANPPH